MNGAVTFPRSSNVLFVPVNVFSAFATAASAGRFVHEYLKDQYEFLQVN